MQNPEIAIAAKARLPTKFGEFAMVGFTPFADGLEHVAMVHGEIADHKYVLCRIHSECLTGDAFGSLRCDCGAQLNEAMEKIAAEGTGVILYLRQEGRGIGLGNKLQAYALQDEGLDTVEANLKLGFNADARGYGPAGQMLRALGIGSVRLLTNNPDKVKSLKAQGFRVTRLPVIVHTNPYNRHYLETKALKMGHRLPKIG